MPEVSFGNLLPTKIKLVQSNQRPEEKKPCSPRILGSIPRNFHPLLPAAPINSHSNQPTAFQWVPKGGGHAATEDRGAGPTPQAPIQQLLSVKHSNSTSGLPLIPRLPDGSLLSRFNLMLRQGRGLFS